MSKITSHLVVLLFLFLHLLPSSLPFLLPPPTSFTFLTSPLSSFDSSFHSLDSLSESTDILLTQESELDESNLPPRLLLPPIIDEHDGDYLGVTYPYDEESIEHILHLCRITLSTLFGYTLENRNVGITGSVHLIGLDGPTVVVGLEGRFWHEETTVVERVKNFVTGMCPEVVDVVREE
ncbi:hypothetical protein TrST_g3340 [Triparma strigata]|uniref:Uncharacterized protein n=1 Tax=Triparma strigata TaxID=1606541 RepID=A0A9W7ALN3_9STRA|nr:hypothetical protein TrST_g3340 [Triparma strigata]